MNRLVGIGTLLLLRGFLPPGTSDERSTGLGRFERSAAVERKTCVAADGVRLVYSAAGSGETALVFIHGGMANRSFFDAQMEALAGRYRVIAVDLAGHGESGTDRKTWGIPQFGADVRAVVEKENVKRAVLFGNSLGGPVAIEAAVMVPDRILGVVGIDTFQDLGHPETAEYAREAADWTRQRLEAFRADYPGAMKAMVKMLFHADADPSLMAEAERRMARTPREVTISTLEAIGGYDPNLAARKLTAPLRAINGDLFPTDTQTIRKIKPDFEAVVMPHMGHYPMLERPEEFNRLVTRIVEELENRRADRR